MFIIRFLWVKRMSVKVSVTSQGVEDLGIRLQNVTPRFVQMVADCCENKMKEFAPQGKTGGLKKSIRQRRLGPLSFTVEAGAPCAVFVERGTRPHEIRPVRARALRFEVGGGVVFARLVRHPGTKPQWFMRRAVEFCRDRVKVEWLRSWGAS